MSELNDVKPRSWAEIRLVRCVRKGDWCELGPERPAQPKRSNTIRSELLRALLLADGFHESGVQVKGAYIKGNLNLDGAFKIRPLHIHNSEIDGDLSFCDAKTATIQLQGSGVKRLRGYGAKIDGDLLLWDSDVESGAHLFGVKITGTLSCEDSRFGFYYDAQNKHALSINLETASLTGNLYLTKATAKAEIRLNDATIRGKLDCCDGKFGAESPLVDSEFKKSPSDGSKAELYDRVSAISALRLKLGGTLFLRRTTSTNELTFTNAAIGGNVDCQEGSFCASSRDDSVALRFARADIGGNVYLRKVNATGKVDFVSTVVRGNIICVGSVFSVLNRESNDHGEPKERVSVDAISFTNAEIKGGLFLADSKKIDDDAQIKGSLDLKGAFARVLIDSVKSWPEQPQKGCPRNVIHLDGFTFERLGGSSPREASKRLKWLSYQPRAHMGSDFRPQPFENLIKVLKDMGHPEEVRALAIEREKHLHRSRWAHWRTPRGALRALAATLSAVTVGWLMGYGYRPLRMVLITLTVGFFCGLYYDQVADQEAFVPRDSQVLTSQEVRTCLHAQESATWIKCLQEKVPEYPRFNPYIYSLNVLFPVVDLFQEKSWIPIRKEVKLALPYLGTFRAKEWMTEVVVYSELAFGGLVGVLAVALFSGLIRKVNTD